MQNNPENVSRIIAFIEVQLGKQSGSISTSEKINLLQKKFRRMLLMMIVNFGIVIFFGYSFYFEITELSQTIFILILVFFGLNLVFLSLQWRRLKSAIKWLKMQE